MSTETLLQRAVEAVHHLTDAEPPWADLLHGASALFGTDGAVLIVQDHGRIRMQQVEASAAAVADYAAHFHFHDVLLAPGLAEPVGTWLETQSILGVAGRRRSAYYNDFMCRHRMRQLGTVLLSRASAQHWASLGLQRERVDERLLARLRGDHGRRYLIELQAGLRARQSLAEQCLLTAEALFGALNEATLLVSTDGAVVQVAPGAGPRLAACGLLHGGRLWHAGEAGRAALASALASALAGTQGVELRLRDAAGNALQLGFVRAAPSLRLLGEALVFVRVRFPAASAALEPERLQQHFSITAAEARVLAALMRGEVAKQYAARERVSVHTVRKQIAMLLQKMDCSRQLELVQKAAQALGASVH